MGNRIRNIAITACGCALALELAACAPNQNDDAGTSVNASPVEEIAWSSDADCSTCHATEQESYENAQCLASKHVSTACVTCHDNSNELANAHENAASSNTKPKKLKQTDISEATCLSCHFGSREDLASATADLVLTDANGTTANPHNLTPSESHDSISCTDCHGMHASEPIEDQARATCYSCHHEQVFECGTCHE